MSARLSEATLDRLPSWVERPRYDRRAATAGVVHLGIGAFHRAHQAVVFDTILHEDPRWAVRAASLRSSGVREALAPQDGLYCLVERAGEREEVRVIGAVRDVLVAPDEPSALVEALAAPVTQIVTLTVTEKGYLPDPTDTLGQPRTAAAFIAAGLAVRRERGLSPLTLLSCDNLPHNGERLGAAVLTLAEEHDPHLRDWIGKRCAFPQTMVDRIVPATGDADIEHLAERTGLTDLAMVKTEPFLQWVIEDRFAGERPDLELAGIQLTGNVAPWEETKLRLLNGAHSAIAYLGGLAGVEFVHDFVAGPAGRGFVEALWNESETTLSPPPGLDAARYRAALMARFSNSALEHRTRQIGVDGSQKLPQRLLAPIAVRLDRGQSIEALALAVAAWILWQEGRDERGERFRVDDPLAGEMERLLAGARSPDEKVQALLGLQSIFPDRLAADPAFGEAIARQLHSLQRDGVMAALSRFAAAPASA